MSLLKSSSVDFSVCTRGERKRRKVASAAPTGGGDGGIEQITRNRISHRERSMAASQENWELVKVTVVGKIIDRGEDNRG